MIGPFTFNIDVPVRNEWHNVTLLVTSVQNCFNAMFANLDGSQTIAMVTGELLENAIKYGSWTSKEHLLRLKVAGEGSFAYVTVENPSDDGNSKELMTMLNWIKSFDSPDEAYRARLLEVAQTPPAAEVSRLGLIRVVYEAGCQIDAVVENGVVRITAQLKL